MGAHDMPDTLYATIYPASVSKIGRFLSKPDTQLRVSPCIHKDFAVRGLWAIPALVKINVEGGWILSVLTR